MPELKARVHPSDPQIAGRASIKDMSLYLGSRLVILYLQPDFQSKR